MRFDYRGTLPVHLAHYFRDIVADPKWQTRDV